MKVVLVALLVAVVLCFVYAGPEQEYVAEWVDELDAESVPVPREQKITQIVDDQGQSTGTSEFQRNCRYSNDNTNIDCNIKIDQEIFSQRLVVEGNFALGASFKHNKLDCVISSGRQNLLDTTFTPIPTAATEKCFQVKGVKTCMQIKSPKYVKDKCFKADIRFIIAAPTGDLELMAPQEIVLGNSKQC